jgi:hypothetical protein
MTAPVAGSKMIAPFTPFELKWDAPQLTDAELARDSSVEWWYFDLSTTDGVELVVIFGRKNPMWSADKASVYVEYTDPSTSFHRVHNYDRSEYSWNAGAGVNELKIGPNSVKIVGRDEATMHYEIVIDLPGITGNLTMKPDHRGFLPTPDGCYFRGKKDPSLRSSVSFSAPLMSVSGSLGLAGSVRPVTGVGYHDHPWATEQFFWTHHVWHWGRATSPESNVMFATVTPFPDFEGTLTFLYVGTPGEFEPTVNSDLSVSASEWKKDGLLGIRFPHDLTVRTTGTTWVAGFKKSLLDVPYYNRADVTWAPQDKTAAGEGWTEYWALSQSQQRLQFWLAKITAFFWRRFPFFGN